jgi:sec-independent protein translocase protein TatA
MCGSLGLPELLIILAIVVLLFGAARLPQLGKALGDTVRNFKKGSTSDPDPVPDKRSDNAIEAHEVAQIVEGDKESLSDELADDKQKQPVDKDG